jgi:hypothetical protein
MELWATCFLNIYINMKTSSNKYQNYYNMNVILFFSAFFFLLNIFSLSTKAQLLFIPGFPGFYATLFTISEKLSSSKGVWLSILNQSLRTSPQIVIIQLNENFNAIVKAPFNGVAFPQQQHLPYQAWKGFIPSLPYLITIYMISQFKQFPQ